MSYDNSNSGALFRNERKTPGDSKPDYAGTWTDASGQQHWLSAWLNEKDGKKYMKLTAQVKEERQQGTRQATPPSPPVDDGEIPL